MNARGYLATSRPVPGGIDLREYRRWCTASQVPAVIVTRATHWIVTVDAGPLPAGRLEGDDLAWLRSRGAAYLEGSASAAPRVKAAPGRVAIYGLHEAAAHALADEIVRRLHVIGRRGGLLDRVRGGVRRPAPIIDLERERRRRRGLFGIARDPWKGGPA